jgi:hypothetical protein
VFEHEVGPHGLGCRHFLVWASLDRAWMVSECVSEIHAVVSLGLWWVIFVFLLQIESIYTMLFAEVLF